VVEGNKRTSLRQDVQLELIKRGQVCLCIRCREVKKHDVDFATLALNDLVYHPVQAEEHLLTYTTTEARIAGYLRLSLPAPDAPQMNLPDLENAALIREVHVYGQSLPLGTDKEGAAQHIGLGTGLLRRSEEIARERGYRQMAVIAAIGTRLYYASRGFRLGELYMIKDL
jgi:elongator complex protein 3